ncbi:MAG: hypothetical protein GX685_07285, partial [Clostridiales bacterium]|nr:hypothetical protein [Clostridiales bacterium]
KNMKKRLSILAAVIACVLSFGVLAMPVAAAGTYDGLDEATAIQYGQQLVQQISEIESAGQTAQYDDGGVFTDAFASWETAMQTLKSFQGFSDNASAVIEDDSLTMNIGIIGENNRTATVTIVADDSGQYTSITTSVEETMAEKLEEAGLNTILGMGMAFAILILIALIIRFAFPPIAKMGRKMEDKKNAPKKAAPAAAPVVAAPVAAVEEESADDGELIAVITAAIAASEGNSDHTGTDGFVVRSIRRRR